MKKLALVLTLALVLAFAAPVFANPFSDVPADHWAYDAISKLQADGVITGNPDGSFTGSKSLTRYEIAVIVAKAMAAAEANADKIAAEDQATIDKLAAEFGSELAALGVKVAALEKKIGNVKITGDARVRYISTKSKNDVAATETKGSKYDSRIRLNATATINDKVSFVGRYTTGDYNLSGANSATPNAAVDNFYVKYTDKVTVIAGRQDVMLGKGLLFDDIVKGVAVSAPVGKYTVTLVNGRLDTDTVNSNATVYRDGKWQADRFDLKALQFDGVKLFSDKVTLGFDYGVVKDVDNKINGTSNELKLAAINLDYAINPNLGLYAEFAKSNADKATTTQKSASTIGITAKNLMPKTTMDLSVSQYGGQSLVPTVTTLTSRIDKDLWNGNTEKVNLTKFKINYAAMANTNVYLELSKAEYKYTNTDKKNKFDRVEAGVEFAF